MHRETTANTRAVQEINPEKFILKNEINAKGLIPAYQSVMMGAIFYSVTIIVFQRISSKILDFETLDHQIVALLAQKIKSKKLPNHLALSFGVTEKKKRILKNIL
ncbi:hypothetical protein [Flavobacterium sp. DSP2-3-1]|uniref:hypothetical protein n=1 Tax=unclassified Flavobacterium TaxID=196869 RepID=UPI003CFB09C4